MGIYIIIAGILLLCLGGLAVLKDKRIEGVLFLATFCFFFLVAGFRTEQVGSDSYFYARLYESFSYGGAFQPRISEFFTGRMEYGYLLLNKVLYSLSSSYVLLFSVSSFITLGITFFVIKKISPNPFLSLVIFFGYRLFSFSMAAIRAGLSISLCTLGFYFFLKKKKGLAFLVILLASSFHLSALMFLILFVVEKIPLSPKTFWISGALAVVCMMLLQPILAWFLQVSQRYQVYGSEEDLITFNLATILNFLVILVVFLFGEWCLKKEEDRLILLLRKIIYLSVLISFVAIRVPLLGRLTLLFGSFILFYIPLVVERIYSFKNRLLTKSLIVLGFYAFFFVILVFKPEWNILVPYQNVLWK